MKKKRINKYEFMQMVHDKVRGICSMEDVYWTTKAVFECMEEILKEGDSLLIMGYFTMYPRLKKERKASNFGNPCTIPEHYEPCFKIGTNLKKACTYLKEHEHDEEDEGLEDEDTRD